MSHRMAKTGTTDHESLMHDYTALWNGDFSKLDVIAESVDVYVPSLADGEIHGRDAFEEYLRELRTGFPDWHVTMDDMVASNGVVMKEWTVTATHEGEYSGIPPTERCINIRGMGKILIADGKVQEDRLYYDFHEMIEQLGLTEE